MFLIKLFKETKNSAKSIIKEGKIISKKNLYPALYGLGQMKKAFKNK
jgi:hypothetical protein